MCLTISIAHGLLKKKCICAWTNKIKHLGHTVTLRVEGGHAMIKKWVAVSTRDLKQCIIDCTRLAIIKSLLYLQRFAFERSTHFNRLSGNFWLSVLKKLSHHALNKVAYTRCALFESEL